LTLVPTLLVAALLQSQCSQGSKSKTPEVLEEGASADAQAGGRVQPDYRGGAVPIDTGLAPGLASDLNAAEALGHCVTQWKAEGPSADLQRNVTIIDVHKASSPDWIFEDRETGPRLNLVQIDFPVGPMAEVRLANPAAWNCLAFRDTVPAKLTVRVACGGNFATVTRTGDPVNLIDMIRDPDCP